MISTLCITGVSVDPFRCENGPDANEATIAIYKNKNFDMYGLDGGVAGHCIVFPGDGFQCSRVIYNVGGVRKFQCLTTITAQQLVDASRLRLEREGKSANTTSAHHFNDSE